MDTLSWGMDPHLDEALAQEWRIRRVIESEERIAVREVIQSAMIAAVPAAVDACPPLMPSRSSKRPPGLFTDNVRRPACVVLLRMKRMVLLENLLRREMEEEELEDFSFILEMNVEALAGDVNEHTSDDTSILAKARRDVIEALECGGEPGAKVILRNPWSSAAGSSGLLGANYSGVEVPLRSLPENLQVRRSRHEVDSRGHRLNTQAVESPYGYLKAAELSTTPLPQGGSVTPCDSEYFSVALGCYITKDLFLYPCTRLTDVGAHVNPRGRVRGLLVEANSIQRSDRLVLIEGVRVFCVEEVARWESQLDPRTTQYLSVLRRGKKLSVRVGL